MKKLYLLILCALAAFGLHAQVVTSEPSPLQEDSENVVIYFHADQGNKGLMGQPASAQLYAHTGVSIIDAAGKAADWQYVQADWNVNLPKCQLKYVSPNLWKLEIGDIHTYYGVPANIKITKLDFVFRGANGSPEGKGVGNTDIFLPVADKGFQLAFTSTQPEGAVNASTGAVTFTAATTVPSTITIAVNGTTLDSAAGATSLTATYTFPGAGDYTVTATANNGTETRSESLSYSYISNSPQSSLTTPPPMGATRNADGSVTFCIAAPGKNSVQLVGSWNDYRSTTSQLMEYIDYAQSGGTFRYFTITLPESTVKRNGSYMYYYTIDGTTNVGDPYARLVIDPWNDKYISPEVFPNLPEYPADKLTGVPLAFICDGMDSFNWTVTNFVAPDKTDLIIYELLLRDFTGTEGKAEGNGTVRQAIAKIPYLKSLGINAVELLPINEFNGNISWGYNPNFYFAVDKAYGTPQDYKEFIDRCHAEGIAVILDMVFNQSDALHPWYMMYTPGSNPFYNLNAPHAYSVLNDWNQGYPLVEQQWKDVLQYWLKEYKVDGFRFDLVKGLGDNDSYSNSGDAATNAYNASRIARMKRLHGYMAEINPNAYFINENLAGAAEENAMAQDGELNWANVNNAGCQFAMGWSSESNLNRMWAKDDSRTLGSTVSYLESHDEQRLAYKQDQYGAAGVKGNAEASCQRLGAAAAQMILVPGSHMIWQFSEMGNAQNTKTLSGGNDTDPKIVNWALLDEPNHKGLFDSYQQLIRLRLDNPELFRSDANADFAMACNVANWANGRTIAARNGDKELYCAINPNTTGSLTVQFPAFLKSDNASYSIYSQSYGCEGSFSAADATITVPANCYVVVASNSVSEVGEIAADAAPFMVTTAKGSLSVAGAEAAVEIYDLAGRKVAEGITPEFTIAIPAGVYIVRSGDYTSK
ncbi:MAG: hypothetical protein K2M93_06580, partial [Muribaculaceae bacterium]|nr:hypothetical protein [Muribaculaceae bacterium]